MPATPAPALMSDEVDRALASVKAGGFNLLGGVPSVIVRPPTLDPTKVTFFDRPGGLCGFRVKGDEMVMSYEDALRFAQMLRVHAKRAKRAAGDTSRHWSAVGTLEDISGR
jgi:hypothetical protein